jgi:methylase of polypeptide subunit release factors
MSYVYGKRGTCKETPLAAAIRGELYPQSYSSIDWNAARNQCAEEDLYYPHPKVLNHFLCTFKFVKTVSSHRVRYLQSWLAACTGDGSLQAASVSADQHHSEIASSISLHALSFACQMCYSLLSYHSWRDGNHATGNWTM